jgi:DNA-directed RNA polymerase specialized sigma24 family protein
VTTGHVTAIGRRHDVTTFDDFVRARLPQLLRFGRALTGDEHRGADLVQDALERALPKWPRIESDDPEGYVRRIMVNRNISVWRSLRRERLTDELPDATSNEPSPIKPCSQRWGACPLASAR